MPGAPPCLATVAPPSPSSRLHVSEGLASQARPTAHSYLCEQQQDIVGTHSNILCLSGSIYEDLFLLIIQKYKNKTKKSALNLNWIKIVLG